MPRSFAAPLCLLAVFALLPGCQSLDNIVKLNRRPEPRPPAMIPRENVGRPPAIASELVPAGTAVQRANTLVKEGKYDLALAEFEKAIEINPKLTVAYMGAGDIYRQKGDYPSAERNYGAAAKLEPNNFGAQYLHGLSLQLLNRLSEAVRAYLRALDIRPDDFNANLNLGTAYLQLGEPGEGLSFAKRAVDLDPKSGPGRTNLGAIYASLNRHEEAVIEFQQAAELTELSAPLLLSLANSLGRTGRYELMVNTLEQLTKTEPTAAAHERLGSGLFHLRRYDESLAAYRKALEIDPNHYPALNGVGVCLMNQWHWSNQADEPARQEALAAWRRSLQLESQQPKILELLGRYK